MKIGIMHPPSIVNPQTNIASDMASGVGSALVKNVSAFAVNKYACLSFVGSAQAELMLISSFTGETQVNFSGSTLFAHNTDDQFTQFDYNQVKIYRSTTGITGVYTYNAALPIDVTSDVTIYEDATSQTNYYYKFSYYNVATGVETSLSDPIAATGFVFHSLHTLVNRVASIFGDSNFEFVKRYEIEQFINEFYQRAQEEYAIATKRQSITFNTINMQVNVSEYPLFSDFFMEKGIRISSDNGQTFPFIATLLNTDHMGESIEARIRYNYMVFGSTIKFTPTPQVTDIAKIFYVPQPIQMVNQTDTLVAPFQFSTSMFVKYGLAMCKLKQNNTGDWTTISAKAESELAEKISFAKKMQSRHPTVSQLVDTMQLQ